MHEREKSDPAIRATKPANAPARAEAERAERRAGAKENASQDGALRTPSRACASSGLERVRQAAKGGKKEQFTALLHHVDVDLLETAYRALKREAAPGVDGMTWREYGEDLERRLADLHGRIHRGAYRAQPSHALRRPSQKDRTLWVRMRSIADQWLPRPRILHPWHNARFAVRHPRWEPDALVGPVRFCAGGAQ